MNLENENNIYWKENYPTMLGENKKYNTQISNHTNKCYRQNNF